EHAQRTNPDRIQQEDPRGERTRRQPVFKLLEVPITRPLWFARHLHRSPKDLCELAESLGTSTSPRAKIVYVLACHDGIASSISVGLAGGELWWPLCSHRGSEEDPRAWKDEDGSHRAMESAQPFGSLATPKCF